VRAVGNYAYEVFLGQVDDHEKEFEELEYTPDVTYRVFKLAYGVAAGGREEGAGVVRQERGALLGFLPGDDGDGEDEDKDDEGTLTEYFTSLIINASPHLIRDLMGNAL